MCLQGCSWLGWSAALCTVHRTEIRIDLLRRGLHRESIALAPVAQEMIALVSKTEHFIKSWLKMMHHKGFDG